jgi:serine/threonine protein kinase
VEGIIGGRFEIMALAGRGGMSRVYRAKDLETGAVVALKVLADQEYALHLTRECTVLASVDHPAIVGHVAHDDATPSTWLAMQWLDGESLNTRLKRGLLSVAEALAVAVRIAAALEHMHARGFVHRDVKPGNVFLAGNAVEGATLIDFGLARAPGADTSEVGLLIGTPGYMAPEQILGEPLGLAADVFALGCLTFRVLHGAPFAGKGTTAVLTHVLYEDAPRLAEVAPQVPGPVAELVDRMLLKAPADRPHLGEVLDVLVRARASSMRPAPPRAPALSARELHVVSVLGHGRSRHLGCDAPARPDAAGLRHGAHAGRRLEVRREAHVAPERRARRAAHRQGDCDRSCGSRGAVRARARSPTA